MNILFTLSQLEVTGAEVFAVTIVDKLIEKGHKVFIISDTLTKETKAEYYSFPLAKRTIPYRIKNVLALKKFIYEHAIDIVLANSRASSWVSSIACKLGNIPFMSVVHGRQATSLSRRLFRGYGYYTFAVCDKLMAQLLEFFKLPPYKVEILRNPFNLNRVKPSDEKKKEKIITLLGRLSGPKGELAYQILDYYSREFEKEEKIKFRVVGGQTIPPQFERFKKDFEFTGFVNDTGKLISESSVVIGSGRLAIAAILRGVPTVAIGEACSIGLISKENLDFALKTNFGDMNDTERNFDFHKIMQDLKSALKIKEYDPELLERMRNEFDLDKITDRMESVFISVISRYHSREIPIIYYHRVIKDNSEAGKHGIYVTQNQFEKHLQCLKKHNFRTVTFNEALELKRANKTDKCVIITFDDGYEDNYTYAFPILKKYSFTAEIFLVAGLNQNDWDKNTGETPLHMLKVDQIKEMHNYGISFGSHTMNHKDLLKCSPEELDLEITGSKKILEEKLGFPIESFAYPYGNCSEEIKDCVKKAGYKYGYATDRAPLCLHEDLFQIRRITIFPNTTNFHLLRKVNGDYIFNKIKNKKDLFNFHL